jgi:hypothetical protein
MANRAAAAKWSADDESAYAEKLLTRIPDALVQRFLLNRVGSKVVGIDADKRNLAGLVAAQSALLILKRDLIVMDDQFWLLSLD